MTSKISFLKINLSFLDSQIYLNQREDLNSEYPSNNPCIYTVISKIFNPKGMEYNYKQKKGAKLLIQQFSIYE